MNLRMKNSSIDFCDHEKDRSMKNEPTGALTIVPSKTILFIHGMYVTPLCWEDWIKYFEEQGYTCFAPPWPHHEGSVAELVKKHPDSELGKLTLEDIVTYYKKYIAELKEKPIIFGHSMGGLVTQILLQAGLCVAGVAIDSAPPKGVITLKWNFIKSNWPHLNPLQSDKDPLKLTLEQFAFAFLNEYSEEDQKALYEKYAVPESRLVGKGPTTATAEIATDKARPPLLLIAGAIDNIIPATLTRNNFRAYKKSPSITEFKEFPARNHWILGQKGWQEVAQFAHEWVKGHEKKK